MVLDLKNTERRRTLILVEPLVKAFNYGFGNVDGRVVSLLGDGNDRHILFSIPMSILYIIDERKAEGRRT